MYQNQFMTTLLLLLMLPLTLWPSSLYPSRRDDIVFAQARIHGPFVSAFGSNSPFHKKIRYQANMEKERRDGLGSLKKRQNGGNGGNGGGGSVNYVPLAVTNMCGDTIYPGIQSQAGSGPDSTGFKLEAGDSRWQWVSDDWQGRVWGRTNCSFGEDGRGDTRNGPVCRSGDCGGFIECQGTVSIAI